MNVAVLFYPKKKKKKEKKKERRRMLLSLHQLSRKVPLTAVQPLCVNLIMDTMRATALATELPNNDSMVKPSVGQSKPFVTRVMVV